MNFAWYLTVWVCLLGQSEATFWKTATPRRIAAILTEHNNIKNGRKKEQQQSLSAFFGGK